MLSSGIFKFILIIILVAAGLALTPTIFNISTVDTTTGFSDITKLGVKVLPWVFFGAIGYAIFITVKAKVQ